MNPAQRAMALAAVQMAMKSKDIGTLPPQFRALAFRRCGILTIQRRIRTTDCSS